MTKMQRMEDRIKKDDEMCARINEILDKLESRSGDYSGDYAYHFAAGAIKNCLETAGRRNEA